MISKQLLEEKLQSARGELLVVGNDLFSHWEGGMGTGLGGRGLYQMVGRRRGEGAIGEEGAPVVVFLQPSPCPLNLLGLVDDLSPHCAWLVCCNGIRNSFPIVFLSI